VTTLIADHRSVTVTRTTGRIVARVDGVDELVAVLTDLARPGVHLTPVVGERPWPTQVGHAVLLLALAARWPWIAESDGQHLIRRHHVTLAYALPLALDAGWRRWAEDHAELLIHGRQLVVVPAADLVAVQPHPSCAGRHRRLLRRHAHTEVAEHHDQAAFLRHWSAFTRWRHDRPLPDLERAALRAILQASGCVVREFVHQDEVIARSVVCSHAPSRTLFDLMAAWHPRHARLRPGIYSAVHNLLDSAQRGWRFSLCYGQFSYKDDIVGGSDRLTLEDLIHGG